MKDNGRDNKAIRWEPGFLVNWTEDDRPLNRLFNFFNQYYTSAWQDAVQFWGEKHEILEEDIDRVLATPPSPERFKILRRFLNDRAGNKFADLIPVEALEPVFREQRAELAAKRASARYRLGMNPKETTESDIALWFEKESSARR